MSTLRRRARGAALGLLADRLAPEPPTPFHPVAMFGRGMQALEGRMYADDTNRGAAYAIAGVATGVGAGTIVRDTTAAVAITAAGHELRRVADAIHRDLERGALEAARATVPALVGRDPSQLDERGVAAAVIESLAENTVDAVVAPVCWALAAGAIGACAYRAVNTMDAMVGHRSERYARFGTWSARADDIANWVPARLTALLVAVVRPKSAPEIWRAVRADAPAHPSPNAGVAEAAFAGALGVQLGGPLRYGERIEIRPLLGGDAPRPRACDIARAIRLADQVEIALVALLALLGARE